MTERYPLDENVRSYDPVDMVAADFNGDGIDDLAMQVDTAVAMTLGAGDGTFGPVQTVAGDGEASVAGWAISDMNGDGLADLVVAYEQTGTVEVLLGTEAGAMVSHQVTSLGGLTPGQIALADFNGDGLDDLVVVDVDNDSLQIRLATSDGFAGDVATLHTGIRVRGLDVADLNDDGVLDIVATSDGMVCILFGDDAGGFSRTMLPVISTLYYEEVTGERVTVVDVNSDGVLDLLLYGSGDGAFLRGMGGGDFVQQQLYASDYYMWNRVARPVVDDINDDGITDVIASSSGKYLGWHRGIGTGGMPMFDVTWAPTDDEGRAVGMVGGDFNRDGLLDVALIIGGSEDSLVIYTGRPDYPAGGATTTGTVTVDVRLHGDTDGDGDVDAADRAVVMGSMGNAGTWSEGDFNGDGIVDEADLDIFEETYLQNTTLWGDFDLDGSLDIDDYDHIQAHDGRESALYQHGDFTNDGRVNSWDLERFRNAASGEEYTTYPWLDTTFDGVVDLDDLVVLKQHFGHEGVDVPGDINRDGVVDQTDYNYFAAVFSMDRSVNGMLYLVDSLADTVAADGVVTLREAIEAANTNKAVFDAFPGHSAKADIITFSQAALSAEAGVAVGQPVTITLGGTQLEITDDLIIQGLGADVLTVDADGQSRVFYILRSSSDLTEVHLIGLTVTGGDAGQHGGGGILNHGGNLTLTQSVVSGNSALFSGGGINSSRTLTLADSIVLGNTVAGLGASGGGIYSRNGALTLTRTTVSKNSASGLGADGGGIYSRVGSVTLTNSTVSANWATGPDSGTGGGISVGRDTLTLTNSTVAGNTAGEEGGGILTIGGTVVLNNAIVSLNVAPTEADLRGRVESYASLLGIDPGFVRDPSSGADGVWGTADDEAGDLRLRDTSVAINLGSTALAVDGDGLPLTTDRDGNPRPAHGQVDIGAYEYQDALSPLRESPASVVTTLVDVMDATDGEISLGEALAYGNLLGQDVTFASDLSGATMTLAGEPLYLYRSCIIDARSIGGLTIDAAGRSRVMVISGAFTEVLLAGLTLTGGVTAANGGGIHTSGMLTLIDSTVTGNSATGDDACGGGIYHNGNTLTLVNSVVSGNFAGADGGGIYSSRGELTLNDSTVSNNVTNGDGGGIYGDGVMLTLTNSTVSDNTATGDGGGIYNVDSAFLIVVDSTVSGNSAYDGGGICNVSSYYDDTSPMAIADSTVSGNSAVHNGGGVRMYGKLLTLTGVVMSKNSAGQAGGGVYSKSREMAVRHSTFLGNVAGGGGGGIFSSDRKLVLANSVLVGNAASDGGGLYSSYRTLTVTNSTLSCNSAACPEAESTATVSTTP